MNVTGRTEMKEIQGIQTILDGKKAIFCDLWGVLHNGRETFPGALVAMENLQKAGLHVVLLSNSPKPAFIVEKQIKAYGYGPGSYQNIVSSGELVREFLMGRPELSCFFIGLERDKPIFEGLSNPITQDLREAGCIVCTGFYEGWGQDVTQYEAFLTAGVENEIPFLCANPDLEVYVGDQKVYCAGMLAKTYETLGGDVTWFGKPHAIAYEKAFSHLPDGIKREEVLAIGDNLETDIFGARAGGIEALFITEGLHGKSSAGKEGLEDLVKRLDIWPDYYMPGLKW